MSRYLIALSIGPVQDFIAAARRSRDLWFGSYLLSEVSKAAALALQSEPGVNLIFPAPSEPTDLEPDSTFNVANKLLAITESGDPGNLARNAKQAAKIRWDNLAENVLQEMRKNTHKLYQVDFHVRKELWNLQVEDQLELFAAWTPWTGDYAKARKRVETLLAARKNTRDFFPAQGSGYGIPKSSLDGKRETVLPDKSKLPIWLKRKLGLNTGEQLDCPGLVKRLGLSAERGAERFTSISRIALDPYLRQIEESDPVALKSLHGPLEALIPDGLVSRVKGNDGIYSALPYDGQVLYPFRLESYLNDLKKEYSEDTATQDLGGAKTRLETLRETIKPLAKYGQPNPYVAVLLADGDRMGKLLDSAADPCQHRQISQALARFAGSVPEILREHRGHCIYSGGDDVLALVPLDKVIACARKLHDDFGDYLNFQFSSVKPTLSVGIAIGHLLEPMGSLLDLARRAEKAAKGGYLPEEQQRDALAIILEPRSGAPIQMRGRWSSQPDQGLNDWIEAFCRDLIPDKAPYELRELARDLHWAKKGLLKAEMKRILNRKRAASGTRAIESGVIAKIIDRAQSSQELRALVDEMLIARRLSKATA